MIRRRRAEATTGQGLAVFAAALVVSLATGGISAAAAAVGGGAAVAELHYLMHTPVLAVARGDDEAAARAAVRGAFAEMRRVEEVVSTFDPASDASRVNRAGRVAGVVVAPELAGLLSQAKALALETEGTFSVLVGPLVGLWRSAARRAGEPSAEALGAARRLARSEVLEIDGRRVRLTQPGASIDLGGIAKGYAADRGLSRMRDSGARAAVVNLGGSSIAAFGDAGDGDPGWPVVVAASDRTDGPEAEIRLIDAALSTSSTRGPSAGDDGQAVRHVIDPRSGEALAADATAVVRHPSATVAEALSKAVLVLGDGAGAVLARHGAEALLVRADGPVRCTAGFRRTAPGCTVFPLGRRPTPPAEDHVGP